MERLRQVHRLLGLVLVLPLIVWTVTGLLFHLKPGWKAAYEQLDAFHASELPITEIMPLADVADVLGTTLRRVELGMTTLGPLYRVRLAERTEPATVLVDARSGEVVSPLREGALRQVAIDAVSRARASERYGELVAMEVDEDEARARFSGGAVLTIHRHRLSVWQRGPDTERIDFLYRLHYLQWTGFSTFDRAFGLLGIGATWLLVGLGLALFRARVPPA